MSYNSIRGEKVTKTKKKKNNKGKEALFIGSINDTSADGGVSQIEIKPDGQITKWKTVIEEKEYKLPFFGLC